MLQSNEERIKERFEKLANNKTFKRIIKRFNLNEKKVLDIGSSYGEFQVLMGKESVGLNSTQEEVDYSTKIGLKSIKGNAELVDELVNEKFDVIWANNLFEHLLSPHAFMIRLKKISKSNTLVILGVPVVPKFASLMRFSKWRGPLASLHVNFFTKDTLLYTAQFAGWKKVEVRPFIFTNATLDYLASFVAPHMYLVVENIADWKYAPKKIHEWESEEMYQKYLKDTNSI